MTRKKTYIVLHTTESGADYKVYANSDRGKCVKWEHDNRAQYPRPLVIESFKY